MRFLKIVLNEFVNENRDKRELSVVASFHTDIIIMAKGDYNHNEMDGNYEIQRRTTRPLGKLHCLRYLNRIVSVYLWASHARKLKPDCISGHDLIALLIGWLSTIGLPKKKKPSLVYDSHEFEIGRNTGGKRKKLILFTITKLEKFLINKCSFSIMVSDSIANEAKKVHNLNIRPIVVRNIPNYWNLDLNQCRIRKSEFCRNSDLRHNLFMIMYHGGIVPNRGIEKIIKVLSIDQDLFAIILGNGEKSYIEQLKHMAETYAVSDRVLFHEAVIIETLWEYVGAADVGIVNIPAVTKSYFYSLPNKLFENIQALTPVIGSDLPEISKVINEYNIGLLVNPESTEELAEAIAKMKNDKELYNEFKQNLAEAKRILCWENESKILREAYRKILGDYEKIY